MSKGNSASGKNLRFCKAIMDIPDRSGYYIWYAKKRELKLLINSKHLKGIQDRKNYYKGFFDCKDVVFDKIVVCGKRYYSIYFGVAEVSLRRRIVGDHVNGIKKSTLRNSISVLIYNGKANEKQISDFMEKLVVRYTPIDNPTDIEENEIAKSLFPLNINKNSANKQKCTSLGSFISALSDLR